MGHMSFECKREKREPNACFRCFKTDHVYQNCPDKPPRNPRTVGAVNDNDQDEPSGSNLALDESRMNVNHEVRLNFLPSFDSHIRVISLFDTGSPVSFVNRSIVPVQLDHENLLDTNYSGLNRTPIRTYGTTLCQIQFQDEVFPINLQIVSQQTMNLPILLGRDFLNKCRISLNYKNNPLCKLYDVPDNIVNSVLPHADSDHFAANYNNDLDLAHNTKPFAIKSNYVQKPSVFKKDNPVFLNITHFSQIDDLDSKLNHHSPLDICLLSNVSNIFQVEEEIIKPNNIENDFNIYIKDKDKFKFIESLLLNYITENNLKKPFRN